MSRRDELSLLRGTYYGVAGRAFFLVLSMVSSILLVRLLGTSQYGTFAFGTLFSGLAGTVAGLGLAKGTVRYVAHYLGDRNTEEASTVIVVALITVTLTSALSAVAVFAASPWISSVFPNIADFSLVLPAFGLLSVPSTVRQVAFSGFQGYEDIRTPTVIQVATQVVWLGTVVVALVIGVSLTSVVYARVGLMVVSAIVSLAYLRTAGNVIGIRAAFQSFSQLRSTIHLLLGFSVPLLLSSFFEFLKNQSDTFVVGFFLSSEAVGLYDVAFKIASLTPLLHNALVGIFLPVFSRINEDLFTARELYQRATKWSATPTIILGVVLFAYPNDFLAIFGDRFTEVGNVFRLLLIAYGMHALFGPNGTALIAFGETKIVAFYTTFGAITNALVSIVLVLELGLMGAAIAVFLSLLLMNLSATGVLLVRYRIPPFNQITLLAWLSLTFGLVIWWIADLRFFNLPPIVREISLVAVGVVLIVLMLILYPSLLSKEDRDLIKSFWYLSKRLMGLKKSAPYQ